MLDSFEKRLAAIIADGLSANANIQLVTRPRGNINTVAPSNVKAVLIVKLNTAQPDLHMGDDNRQRMGVKGDYKLKTVLNLKGSASIECRIAPIDGAQLEKRRSILLTVLDSLLAMMQADSIRNGRAFDNDTDQGFRIEGFRLAEINPIVDTAESFSRIEVVFNYNGQFWPVVPEAEGDAIELLPMRMAILPLEMAEHVKVKAGVAQQAIPVRMDIRAMSGAVASVVARLSGASPAGTLSGDTSGLVDGWTGFTVNAQGECRIAYVPPTSIAAPATDHVVLAMRTEQGVGALLGEFDILVEP
jgi:hypothetical protein